MVFGKGRQHLKDLNEFFDRWFIRAKFTRESARESRSVTKPAKVLREKVANNGHGNTAHKLKEWPPESAHRNPPLSPAQDNRPAGYTANVCVPRRSLRRSPVTR